MKKKKKLSITKGSKIHHSLLDHANLRVDLRMREKEKSDV